jgi:flagellar M-ring protein FliF
MDTALASPSSLALNGGTSSGASDPGFGSRLAALPPGRKAMLGLGLAGLVAIAMAMSMWSSQGNYKVLYANLSDKDGGAILAQLSQMNVPYQHAAGGTAILVPADKVHDVRLKLASAGLPKGGVVGFELMDNAKFGQTQFQERLTFQRGLEGELTRSIGALAAVQAARVHLALPNQNGFFREQQKPSASVLLTLHPGRTLDRAQIAGIVHLVSSSVPELNPKAVSVLDATGALLSGSPEADTGAGLDAQQLQYRNQVETSYTRRVTELLEPVLGRDNLRAQVTAEIDFSQTESTSEAYAPNQGIGPDGKPVLASVRSEQTSTSATGASQTPSGVPGATSNQPPTPATAPITGGAQPLVAAAAGTQGGTGRRDATTNYEIDKTVRVTRNATGTVKRLNAAVVVNHKSVTDAKGKTTVTPLSAEELDKLTALVKESIGFSAERGDSVKLINAPFKVDKPLEDIAPPLWQQPQVQDMIRTLAVPGALTLLALIVVFGAVRPALKAAQVVPVSRLDAVVDDAQQLPALTGPQAGRAGGLPALEAPAIDNRLEMARALAKENPAAMANIVRSWVAKEA